jgi:hypothetical protein
MPAHCLFAQNREFVLRVNRALAALDSAQTERGADSLRALLGQWPSDASTDARLRASIHLGAAMLSLGLRDSALARFGEVVRLNPFFVSDPDVFNPEIIAAFREARRTTPSVGITVTADTVITPLTESYHVAVAVGQPGDVVVRLVRAGAASPSVEPTRLAVDSSVSFAMPLRMSDSVPLEPGDYRLTAEINGTDALSATVILRITRQSVDTANHEPALDPLRFRPEARRGPLAARSALSGIAFGLAAVAVPMVLGNKNLGGGKAQASALSVGIGISLAGFAGVVLGQRMVPIDENVQYNRSLVREWEQRNRAIADVNDVKRGLAPLRITLTQEVR